MKNTASLAKSAFEIRFYEDLLTVIIAIIMLRFLNLPSTELFGPDVLQMNKFVDLCIDYTLSNFHL